MLPFLQARRADRKINDGIGQLVTTENETAQATAAAAERPEPPKKAHTAARTPRVAPSKPKAARKTTSAKKGANAPATMFPKTEPGLQRLVANFTGAKPYLSREPWFGCRTVLFLPRR